MAEQPQEIDVKALAHLTQIRLIGVTGKANSGKDTVGTILGRRLGALTMSCADPIKETLSRLFGFPDGCWKDRRWKETPLPMLGVSPRILAQTFGTEWGRQMVHEDIWVSRVIGRWRNDGYKLTAITDVRFDNEAIAILRAGGMVIRVERPDTDDVAEHASEAGIADNLVHQTVINDGTIQQLDEKVQNAVREHAEMVQSIRQKQIDANAG